MLIVTCDAGQPLDDSEFVHALSELNGLRVSRSTWLLPGEHSASGLLDVLEPLLPDRDRDALFIAHLDAFAELQWANTLTSDAEIGGLIRLVRERGTPEPGPV
jgi:hypothetical protein